VDAHFITVSRDFVEGKMKLLFKNESAKIEEFYQVLVDQATGRYPIEMATAMLALIAALRALPDEREVWCLTSHNRLCLLTERDYRTPWYVIIDALDTRNYTVEYLMPAEGAPWPNAYVRGEARSTEAALKMVVIAMSRCEGWKDLELTRPA
jgi:hypothetical protein